MALALRPNTIFSDLDSFWIPKVDPLLRVLLPGSLRPGFYGIFGDLGCRLGYLLGTFAALLGCLRGLCLGYVGKSTPGLAKSHF